MRRPGLVGLVLLAAFPVVAEEPLVAPETVKRNLAEYRLGAIAAQEVSETIGVSLTPMMGTALVGAARYLTSPASQSAPLSSHPGFFVPLLVIVLILAFGRSALFPEPVLKRVAKSIAVFESKASALVLIPLNTIGFASAESKQAVGAVLQSLVAPVAWADSGQPASGLTEVIGSVGLTVIGFTVWLLGHTVRVLCLLSPFGVIDVLLRSMKNGAILFLLAAHVVSPWAGLAVAAVYLLIAILLAGWSFRLTVFGTVFCLDLLFITGRKPGLDRILAFASSIPQVPVRTLGWLQREGASVQFTWRPWLVLKPRTVSLPPVVAVEKGFIHPVIVDSENAAVVRLPPRYRSTAAELAKLLSLEVREQPLLRGLAAARAWLRDQWGRVRRVRPA